jgi:hypothetical protein
MARFLFSQPASRHTKFLKFPLAQTVHEVPSDQAELARPMITSVTLAVNA